MACINRLVPTLVLLAGLSGLTIAAETVVLTTNRASLHATVALDEFQAYDQRGVVAGAAAIPGRVGALRVQVAGRANLVQAARDMIGQGLATRVCPVIWIGGVAGNPDGRIEVERRMLIEPAAGTTLDVLMQAHGLIKPTPVDGRPGWWMVEPADPSVLAPIDALKTLQADQRVALAYPDLRWPNKPFINDPMLRNDQPGPPPIPGPYPWHLLTTPASGASTLDIGGINGDDTGKVWQDYSANGLNIMIVDDGVQLNHPDLTINAAASATFATGGGTAGGPTGLVSNHGTFVAGLAAATGNNGVGTAGVAYGARIVSRAILANNNDGVANATDAGIRDAWLYNISAGQEDAIWAINNSWGPGLRFNDIGPLTANTLYSLSNGGRQSHGTPVIFAAGNSGSNNVNAPQNGTGFNGNNNRYTITVAALGIDGGKAGYSEVGPNITISAPGGTGGAGMVSTDRTDPVRFVVDAAQARGYIAWSPTDIVTPRFRASDFNGDGNVTGDLATGTTPQRWDGLPYENGSYAPSQAGMQGTSFAAPLVTGMAALMASARKDLTTRDIRGVLISRGQGYRPPTGGNVGIHGTWDDWVANVKGLQYNNWYGFGRMVAGPIFYGGTGVRANKDSDGLGAGLPIDEPGVLRWPLLPIYLIAPIAVPGSRYVSSTNTLIPLPYSTPPTGNLTVGRDVDIPDAPGNGRIDNVPDTLRKATYDFVVDQTQVPVRFRIESVELTVAITATSATLSNWADYSFELVSPDGSICTLGRQSDYGNSEPKTGNGTAPGTYDPTPYGITNGMTESWTFTELFHYLHPAISDTTDVGRTWRLLILDERSGGTARIESASLRMYGHQTYPVPILSQAKPTGPANPPGVGSGSDASVNLTVSGVSSAAVAPGYVTTVYWDPDGRANPILPFILQATGTTAGLRVTIPASLLPTASPGQGTLSVGNPALVDGRAGTIDRFETPNIAMITQTPGEGKRMKMCDPTEDKVIKYSRRPVVSGIADIRVTAAGAIGPIAFTATDPDVDATPRLPTAAPETLVVTATSFNSRFFTAGAPAVVAAPNGSGSYTLSGMVNSGSSGFALVNVYATDGVTTTVSSFRVIIPSTLDSSGCGGGMGLALLGIPLAVWFIRRRRQA